MNLAQGSGKFMKGTDAIPTSTETDFFRSDAESTSSDIAFFNGGKSATEIVKWAMSYVPKNKEVTIDMIRNSLNTKIKRFKDSIYFGEMVNGRRHGKGIMFYKSGRIYEGEWMNDAKFGKGLEIHANGNKYEGQFLNGKPDGFGIYYWVNGEIYEGEWSNGLKSGSGVWRGTEGETYMGGWKFGGADGTGVLVSATGDNYEGEFKACVKHGQGTETFANGDYYKGQYENGKPNGYGEYYWADGSVYKGGFQNGMRKGRGTWRKGEDRFEGNFANDYKCGYGEYRWASGNVFKGNYFDDQRHGYGEMYWIDGTVYKGNWMNGVQHGEGTLISKDQPPQTGHFENNVFIRPTNNIYVRDGTPTLQAEEKEGSFQENGNIFTAKPQESPNLGPIKGARATGYGNFGSKSKINQPVSQSVERQTAVRFRPDSGSGNEDKSEQQKKVIKKNEFVIRSLNGPAQGNRNSRPASEDKQFTTQQNFLNESVEIPNPNKEKPKGPTILTRSELIRWFQHVEHNGLPRDTYTDLDNPETAEAIRALLRRNRPARSSRNNLQLPPKSNNTEGWAFKHLSNVNQSFM